MNTKTKQVGTCACCFREFASTSSGISTRHGWSEYDPSGRNTRQVGQYGNVTHSGPCPGVRFPPYELSAEGSRFMLGRWQAQQIALKERIAQLSTRPTIKVEFKVGRHNFKDVMEMTDISEGEVVHGITYDVALQRMQRMVGGLLVQAEGQIAFFTGKIESWVLASLREEAVEGPAVHFRLQPLGPREDPRRNPTYCGNRTSYGLLSTQDRSEVTCTRCLAVFAQSDAMEARKQSVRESMARLVALLGDGRARSVKEIKAELEFDQQTLNSVIELDRRVSYADRVLMDHGSEGKKMIGLRK